LHQERSEQQARPARNTVISSYRGRAFGVSRGRQFANGPYHHHATYRTVSGEDVFDDLRAQNHVASSRGDFQNPMIHM